MKRNITVYHTDGRIEFLHDVTKEEILQLIDGLTYNAYDNTFINSDCTFMVVLEYPIFQH